MNTPQVSIIVPCYNYGHFLGQTLENVRAQEYTDWECIIVDDGSTDNTAEIARRITDADPRFCYIHQNNKGLSAARNTGIRQSRGQFIQLLDSDDLIHAAKLTRQISLLNAHPHTDILYGKALFFKTAEPNKYYSSRKQPIFLRQPNLQISGQGKMIVRKLLVDNIMPVSSALIRRSMVDKVGGFDETYKSYEDWHYWIRCALQNANFAYIPLEGTETYIRIGHPSMMTNKKKMTMHAIRLRKYLHPHLNRSMQIYNFARLFRLYTRKIFNIY